MAAEPSQQPNHNASTNSKTIQESVADGTNGELPLPAQQRSTRQKATETGHGYGSHHDMDMLRALHTGNHCSSSLLSEESALNCDLSFSFPSSQSRQVPSESPSMQAVASGAQHSESNAASFHWPILSRLHGTAEERSKFFNGLQKVVESDTEEKAPAGQQATTLLDLMLIRAYHSKALRRFSLATAIGFRTQNGILTKIPAIIVFVARKVHKEWLQEVQRLPYTLPGPGGIWCDVDVVEFSYYGTPADTPKEQVYTELVEKLQGNDPSIGPGSQVASQETYGTLGAIVQSRTGSYQVGFLTNRHVAVDLDYPNQKMFHPLPPNLGPGVYLGAVERATSFITDDLWYSIFASKNPETFVRADGAFIPFGDSFDISRVTTTVKGVGDMGDVMKIDLQAPIESIVGRQVVKVGRSSGRTKGRIMAYALEYNDEKGICFFTDFLIVGENNQAFDLEGDSGSLILMVTEEGKKHRPVGIIWGGTANRGRLKLQIGHEPENWTSGVDLGRLLELLQLDLVTSNEKLEDAVDKQRRSVTGSTVGDIFHRPLQILDSDVTADAFQETVPEDTLSLHLRLPPQQIRGNMPGNTVGLQDLPNSVESTTSSTTKVELGLIDFGFAPMERGAEGKTTDHGAFRENGREEFSFDLHMNEREVKRRKS